MTTEHSAALATYAELAGLNPARMGVLAPAIADAGAFAADCWDATGVDPADMRVTVEGGHPCLILRNPPPEAGEWADAALHGAGFTDWAVRQLSNSRLAVPWRYARQLVYGKNGDRKGARKIAPEPEAFAVLLNQLLDSQSKAGKKWLVRCHRAEVRAILTDRYAVFDTIDLLAPTARALDQELADGTVRLDHYSHNETKWRLSFTLENARFPVPEDERGGVEKYDRHLFGRGGAKAQADGLKDTGTGLVVDGNEHGKGTGGVQRMDDHYLAGFQLGNSEVGDGGTQISPRLWRYYCSNAAIVEQLAWREIHRGGSGISGAAKEIVEGIIRRAIVHSVKAMPSIITAMSKARLEAEDDPGARLELIAVTESLGDDVRRSMLAAFRAEAAQTRFGVIQAITRAAKDHEGPARADLEQLGGRITMMLPTEYEKVYALPEKEVAATV